jgi:hypothetical protein
VNLITEGVQPGWVSPPVLPWIQRDKSVPEVRQAERILQEYLEIGAVDQVSPKQARFLVPWFVISKREGAKEKLRLISDCRLINEHMEARHFKMDHWGKIFPFLRKSTWAAKIDLKNAYFHLGLSEALKEFLVLKVGEKYYQFQGAAFGLSTLPQLWMMLMKTFSRLWRKKGILCFIYLDDILLINTTQ